MVMTREATTPDTMTPAENNSESRFFYLDSTGPVTDLVAVGTDGSLYLVPAEPGGWLKRSRYDGQKTDLTRVSSTKAAFLTKYLYGDIGLVQMLITEEVESAP
jgi:hypothetical protein